MISAKVLIEKLSADDRKTLDKALATYSEQAQLANEADKKRGGHRETNVRHRQKFERAKLQAEVAANPSRENKAALEKLARTHALEISEAPSLRQAAATAKRAHVAAAGKAIAKIWPMLIPAAESLREEYVERDKQDRERLGVSAPGIVEEIDRLIRGLKIRTGEVQRKQLGEVQEPTAVWLQGKRITDKGSNTPEPEPVKVQPPPKAEDTGDFSKRPSRKAETDVLGV